ncbi:MAG: glycosyltransferase family 2 protein [Magnetococcales bacterium]|nr:glycosyltransferase family 2 protein [Magnetococcales bacterium]
MRIVIVNFHADQLLQQLIDALLAQKEDGFEVVIVDNEAADNWCCLLPDHRFRIIPVSVNLGFAAAANLGANNAQTEWLSMLNPDTIPDEDWLVEIKEAIRNHPDTALFGSCQRMASQPDRLDGAGDAYSIFGIAWRGGYGHPHTVLDALPSSYRTFSPCAAAAFYRRDQFALAGGFAESFFCYLEDVDLAFRLTLLGQQTRQINRAQVYHIGSAITGRHSPFTIYHSVRNGVWVLLRCMPTSLLLFALPLYLLAQSWLMVRNHRSAAHRLRGIVHGLLAWRTLWQQRALIQASSLVKARQLASLLTWNPVALQKRRIMVLPTIAEQMDKFCEK